ncbi:MAG: 5-dehydro-4-deoxyglucarate dehydratase [Mycobacterium sp.]|nr:5-dehydro-4-deoxyglucarate dehydratase [Mycobacterium sp.]
MLPPYLVAMPQDGLVAYTREVAAATDLPLIVYNRGNARYSEASAVEVARLPNVVGFKDGTGDVDLVARIVRAVTDALTHGGKPFQFFNGLPTAEVSQQAYGPSASPCTHRRRSRSPPNLRWRSTRRWSGGMTSSSPHFCASSSTRWSGCGTPCPVTRCP